MGTKKVVINDCFGGFGLSPLGLKRLAELQGRECYFYKFNYPGPYTPTSLEDAQKQSMFVVAFDTPEYPGLADQDNFYSLTLEERQASNADVKKHSIEPPEDRSDSLLIQVVEELGEKANGRCAKLKIVEIPDDVEYEIDEYDGNETIREKHRTWS